VEKRTTENGAVGGKVGRGIKQCALWSKMENKRVQLEGKEARAEKKNRSMECNQGERSGQNRSESGTWTPKRGRWGMINGGGKSLDGFFAHGGKGIIGEKRRKDKKPRSKEVGDPKTKPGINVPMRPNSLFAKMMTKRTHGNK